MEVEAVRNLAHQSSESKTSFISDRSKMALRGVKAASSWPPVSLVQAAWMRAGRLAPARYLADHI